MTRNPGGGPGSRMGGSSQPASTTSTCSAWMLGDVECVTAMTAHALAAIEAEDTGIATFVSPAAPWGGSRRHRHRPKDLEDRSASWERRGPWDRRVFQNDLKTWQFCDPLLKMRRSSPGGEESECPGLEPRTVPRDVDPLASRRGSGGLWKGLERAQITGADSMPSMNLRRAERRSPCGSAPVTGRLGQKR